MTSGFTTLRVACIVTAMVSYASAIHIGRIPNKDYPDWFGGLFTAPGADGDHMEETATVTEEPHPEAPEISMQDAIKDGFDYGNKKIAKIAMGKAWEATHPAPGVVIPLSTAVSIDNVRHGKNPFYGGFGQPPAPPAIPRFGWR